MPKSTAIIDENALKNARQLLQELGEETPGMDAALAMGDKLRLVGLEPVYFVDLEKGIVYTSTLDTKSKYIN